MSLEKFPSSFFLNLNPHPSSSSSTDITEMIKLSDIYGSYILYSQPTPTYSKAAGESTCPYFFCCILLLGWTFTSISTNILCPTMKHQIRLNENKGIFSFRYQGLLVAETLTRSTRPVICQLCRSWERVKVYFSSLFTSRTSRAHSRKGLLSISCHVLLLAAVWPSWPTAGLGDQHGFPTVVNVHFNQL